MKGVVLGDEDSGANAVEVSPEPVVVAVVVAGVVTTTQAMTPTVTYKY